MTNASFKTTYNSLIFTHSGASVASFSDDRCEADGVCPSDPLTFTCEINGALSLRVVFPSSNYRRLYLQEKTSMKTYLMGSEQTI